MYNLQDNSIKSEGSSVAIFPLGISSGNELTNIEKGQASNGNTFLKFTFTATDGSTVSHFEWPIDTTADNAQKKFESQFKRLKHIMTKFVDESQLPVANSFDELADKVITTLSGKTAGVKLHVKTTYTWNDFVGIPSYVPFLEVETGNPTTLRVTSQEEGGIDKMTKANADSESDVAAQLAQPNPAFGAPAQAAPATGGTNLPF